MNEIIKSLFERKSVRVFTGEPVTEEEKALLLECAFQAPTAGCQQMYTILDIVDRAEKEALAELCDHQGFIAQAPLVLIFLADCRRWLDVYGEAGVEEVRSPGPGDLLLAMADAVIAAQNVVAAAESLGLGSCYIGDVMERCEEHRSLLHLPEYVFPAAMLVLGWPTRQQKDRPKPPRAALEHIVHENTYRRMGPAELEAMLAPKAGARDYRDWLAAFCARKYNSDFSREMTRSVEAYLAAFGGTGADVNKK